MDHAERGERLPRLPGRPQLRRRGLAAAAAVARRAGLPAGDLQVLSDRGNLIVRLAPAPVVARVCTLTAWSRRDPRAWMAREVAVATAAAAAGGPVLPPTPLADPGPHRHAGLSLTLWTFLPPSAERPGPAEVGVALADLHRSLAGFGGPLPWLAPVHQQIPEALEVLERAGALPADVLARLRAELDAVRAGLAVPAGREAADGLPGAAAGEVTGAGALHGDAHPGNLLRSGTRWLWTDLEESCAGPPLWDLAVLAGTGDGDGAAAVRAYAAASGMPEPHPAELAPYRRARALEGTAWLLAMAHQDPQRYAEPARRALHDGYAGGGSPPR